MKLLPKSVSESKIRQENEVLVDQNIRLREFEGAVIGRLNTIKESYEPDKIEKLKEFEEFCADILQKKAKLLKELKAVSDEVEKKKDIYYGLIAKQDVLDERMREISEEEGKLKRREVFVLDLEKRWREKQ